MKQIQDLPFKIIQNNENDVPIIETDEKDSIIQSINLDSVKIANDRSYLTKKLKSSNRKMNR